MGLHGQRRAWTIRKMSEHDALNVTLRRLQVPTPIEEML